MRSNGHCYLIGELQLKKKTDICIAPYSKKLNFGVLRCGSHSIHAANTPHLPFTSKVKVTGSQKAKRRSNDRRELCTLSSAQPLVFVRRCLCVANLPSTRQQKKLRDVAYLSAGLFDEAGKVCVTPRVIDR